MSGVLIDGILPDMHGFQLAKRLVGMPEGRFVAVCFVTGALREASSFAAGVGALSKPVRLEALRGMVEKMLAWRNAGGSPPEARQQSLQRVEQAFLVGP